MGFMRCSPHHWRIPTKVCASLLCDRCGFELSFSVITPEQKMKICEAFERRQGYEEGARFRAAWAANESYTGPRWEDPGAKRKAKGSRPPWSRRKTRKRRRR